MSDNTSPLIQLDELPARLRLLAADMKAVGGAVSYFGGFGPFGEWGRMLSDQSSPMCREIAARMESMRGGRA